jgi:hypothetical protein
MLLLDALTSPGLLQSTKYVCAGEKLMILYTTGQIPNRSTQKVFQHSGDTIHSVFHQVIDAPMIVKKRLYITNQKSNQEYTMTQNISLLQKLLV